jgi:hypothetical protein
MEKLSDILGIVKEEPFRLRLGSALNMQTRGGAISWGFHVTMGCTVYDIQPCVRQNYSVSTRMTEEYLSHGKFRRGQVLTHLTSFIYFPPLLRPNTLKSIPMVHPDDNTKFYTHTTEDFRFHTDFNFDVHPNPDANHTLCVLSNGPDVMAQRGGPIIVGDYGKH